MTGPKWLDGRSQEPCEVEGCTRTKVARGYCDPHYRRWKRYWAFVADVGERPEGTSDADRAEYSLDRINNDRGYEPGNVRWATASVQAGNKRRALGAAS